MVRKRIKVGYLVASTNPTRSIIAKRLIVEVKYNPVNYRCISDRVLGTRTSFAQ